MNINKEFGIDVYDVNLNVNVHKNEKKVIRKRLNKLLNNIRDDIGINGHTPVSKYWRDSETRQFGAIEFVATMCGFVSFIGAIVSGGMLGTLIGCFVGIVGVSFSSYLYLSADRVQAKELILEAAIQNPEVISKIKQKYLKDKSEYTERKDTERARKLTSIFDELDI